EESTKFCLNLPALGDVPDGSRYKLLLLGLHRSQADFGRKFRSVFAAAVEVKTHSHGPRARLGEVAVAMVGMKGAVAVGHEDFDGLTEQLLALIAEKFLRLAIDEHDAPVLADDYHGIRRGLQQPAHPRSARPILPEAL